jgi:hypothetical protein
MKSRLNWQITVLAVLAVVFTAVAWQTASADEDLVHIVKGTVKSVDKDSKTMVVKAADGTEHDQVDGQNDHGGREGHR